MKTHIIYIHGGETFKNDRDYVHYLQQRSISLERRESWSGDYLNKELCFWFDIIMPRMPLRENARYRDWKIVLDRYLDLVGPDFILIGNSLGGIFLAKYLSEVQLAHKAQGAYLVCPPYDSEGSVEDLVGGFELGNDLSLIQKNTDHLRLYFSADDPIVPPIQAHKYRAALQDARIALMEGKNGHFFVSEFPELVADIKHDSNV